MTWGIVFYLHSLKLVEVLQPFSHLFIANIFGVLFFALLCYAFAYLVPLRKLTQSVIRDEDIYTYQVRKITIRLLKACAIIFFITIIFFGGFPLLWIFLGIEKTYSEFGFPTIHGLFNALLILLGTIAFWFLSSGRRFPVAKYILIFCILIPILSLHRQSLVSLLLQCMFIYVAIRAKGGFKEVRSTLIFVIILSIAFSTLGDIRTGNDVLLNLAGSGDIIEIPAPLLWIYLYLTTPIGNFHDLTQLTFSHTFGATSISNLTPTFFREIIWGERIWVMQDFTGLTFNAYSYAFVPYLDFGWYGVYFFTGVTIFFATMIYRGYVITGNLYYLLNLAIMNQIIFLFIFSNLLLTWGIIFQFVIIRIFKKTLCRIDGKLKHKNLINLNYK